MADNRLFLRCSICHETIPIARLSVGETVWSPARIAREELAIFLQAHGEHDGDLHVDLQSETDRRIAVGPINPSSIF